MVDYYDSQDNILCFPLVYAIPFELLSLFIVLKGYIANGCVHNHIIELVKSLMWRMIARNGKIGFVWDIFVLKLF